MGSSKNIEHQVNLFFQIKPNHFLSQILLLSSHLSKKNETSSRQIARAIHDKITDDQLNQLFEKVCAIDDDTFYNFDKKTQQSLFRVKKWVLSHDSWCEKLHSSTLVVLGQREDLCRWAVYRLIQKANPDEELFISSKLLNKAGIEQSYETVAKLYAPMPSLPIEHLAQLASSESLARMVLKDTSFHGMRFELGALLLEQHKRLAPEIAQAWRGLQATQALMQNEVAALATQSSKLAVEFPQFEEMHEKRIKQGPSAKPSHAPSQEDFDYWSAAGAVSVLWKAPAMLELAHAAQLGVSAALYGTAGPTLTAVAYSATAVGTYAVAPLLLFKAGQFLYQRSQEETPQSVSKPKL